MDIKKDEGWKKTRAVWKKYNKKTTIQEILCGIPDDEKNSEFNDLNLFKVWFGNIAIVSLKENNEYSLFLILFKKKYKKKFTDFNFSDDIINKKCYVFPEKKDKDKKFWGKSDLKRKYYSLEKAREGSILLRKQLENNDNPVLLLNFEYFIYREFDKIIKPYIIEIKLPHSCSYSDPYCDYVEYDRSIYGDPVVYSTVSGSANKKPELYLRPFDIVCKDRHYDSVIYLGKYLGKEMVFFPNFDGKECIISWEEWTKEYKALKDIKAYHTIIPFKKKEEMILQMIGIMRTNNNLEERERVKKEIGGHLNGERIVNLIKYGLGWTDYESFWDSITNFFVSNEKENRFKLEDEINKEKLEKATNLNEEECLFYKKLMELPEQSQEEKDEIIEKVSFSIVDTDPITWNENCFIM